jgi:integrase
VPVLFTDLTNRTTNDIYQRLGYRPVEDRLEIEFQSVETIADNANGQPFAPSSVVAALVKVPVPRAHRAPVWTVEEARAFLESARTANDPFYAAYVLMLVLGLRRGEIFGLAWSEVDLEAREALIAWHLQRVAGRLLRRETKTAASDATLPLPEVCVHAPKGRLELERRFRSQAEAWHESGLVITRSASGSRPERHHPPAPLLYFAVELRPSETFFGRRKYL